MAEPTPGGEIKLKVLVEGDNPDFQVFTITVQLQDDFCDVRPVIQKAYWESEQISIYGLRLYKANLPSKQIEHAQLSNETLLRANELVARPAHI
ncbi:hypothetical protein RSOL_088330, partial [Rhizoctonia solani AG-3 Rhs1AP]